MLRRLGGSYRVTVVAFLQAITPTYEDLENFALYISLKPAVPSRRKKRLQNTHQPAIIAAQQLRDLWLQIHH